MSALDGHLQRWVLRTLNNPPDKGHTVEGIISYIDYKDHCRYSPEEVTAELERLREAGQATERDSLWYVVANLE